MKLFDKLTTDENGKFSHTRFWSSIAYAVASFVIVKLTYMNTLTVDFFTWYLVIAGGHSALAKYINARSSGSYQFPSQNYPPRPTARNLAGAAKTPEEDE